MSQYDTVHCASVGCGSDMADADEVIVLQRWCRERWVLSGWGDRHCGHDDGNAAGVADRFAAG